MKAWNVSLLVALLLSAVSAAGQTVTGFMKVPNIPGDSVEDRHANEIRIFSVTQQFDAAVKNMNPCLVTLTKPLDKAGPLLFVAAVTGQNLGQVKIDLVASGESAETFYQILLTNARVVGIVSSPQQLVENVTMVGDSISLAFKPQSQSGGSLPAVEGSATCK